MGVNAAPYDALLAQLGHDQTIDSWLSSGEGWFHANAAIGATNDSALIDAWVAWNEAELGTAAELAAWSAFNVRLVEFLVQNVTDADRIPAGTVQATRLDER